MQNTTPPREIGKALGLGTDVEFQGQTWHLEPLTFLDLGHAEALGLIREEDGGLSPTTIMWLMLRKADPSLTPQKRDFCQYRMTPREASAVFALSGNSGEVGTFMAQVMSASGLTATPEEAGAEDDDAGGKLTEETPSKKGGRASKPALTATATAE